MLTLLFAIFFIGIFGKLFLFALKAAWSITKLIFTFLFLPFILLGLVFNGLILIAFPGLILIGILAFLLK